MKYADNPEKFMDSELELYQELKRLHALATAPELYPTFVRTRCVPSLLGLLAHENADISIDVVEVRAALGGSNFRRAAPRRTGCSRVRVMRVGTAAARDGRVGGRGSGGASAQDSYPRSHRRRLAPARCCCLAPVRDRTCSRWSTHCSTMARRRC